MVALRKPVFTRMTVPEFVAWQPQEHADHRWQLIDGEPVCMAPASENHGAIQSEAALLIGLHLRAARPACRVIIAPGVSPRVRSQSNFRVPDLGVTCAPPSGGYLVDDPVLLVEILSPSNELLTRLPGSSWPASPMLLGAEDAIELASVGLRTPLRLFYRTTSLFRG